MARGSYDIENIARTDAHLREATAGGDPFDRRHQGPRPQSPAAVCPATCRAACPTERARASTLGNGRRRPVFGWLQKTGQVPTDDMLRTFNCGLGMIVVVAKADVARVTKALADAGESVREVGIVEHAPTDEADCVIEHADHLWRSEGWHPDFGPRQQHGALANAAKAADYPAEIACVVSNVADAPGLKVAEHAGIATSWSPIAASPTARPSIAPCRQAGQHGVELVVLAGFLRILQPVVPRALGRPGDQHPPVAAAGLPGIARPPAGAGRRRARERLHRAFRDQTISTPGRSSPKPPSRLLADRHRRRAVGPPSCARAPSHPRVVRWFAEGRVAQAGAGSLWRACGRRHAPLLGRPFSSAIRPPRNSPGDRRP